MEIIIEPYKVIKRTEYSKPRLIDINTNIDITSADGELLDMILDDYEKQTNNPEKYFEIDGNSLVGFHDNRDITFLFIPEGIEIIDELAFRGGTFDYVHFPESVSLINYRAFANCTFLKELYIPDSVKDIGECAFGCCESLRTVRLPKYLKKINSEVFCKCTKLKNIDIPDSVSVIERCAFFGCRNLEEVSLSENLYDIGNSAFYGCGRLKNIEFPNKLNSINRECFVSCGFSKINLPDSLTHLFGRAFAGCVCLESIKLSNNLMVIHKNTFDECRSLNNIYLPNNLGALAEGIFSDTRDLEQVNIPEKLMHIEPSPFGNSSVKTLLFNHNLEHLNISKGDLLSDSKIDKLIIDKTVEKITSDAFRISGKQITKIDYLGTREEFEDFKINNKELFDLLNLKEINLVEDRPIITEGLEK